MCYNGNKSIAWCNPILEHYEMLYELNSVSGALWELGKYLKHLYYKV